MFADPFDSLLINFPFQYFRKRKAIIGLRVPYIISFLLIGFKFFHISTHGVYFYMLLTGINLFYIWVSY